MRNASFRAAAIIAALFTLTTTLAASEEPTGKFVSVFNGKNLDGWQVPEDNVWWKAEQGVLKVASGPKRQGSTLWTDESYENFILKFEFKMGDGIVDSGIFVRNSKEQIQIGISGSLKRDMTASPYIAGKGYPVEAMGVAKLLKPKDWNAMTIKAEGKNYSVWLNGKHVMSYDSATAIQKGPIGIQLHGNRDMSIDYRKLFVAEL